MSQTSATPPFNMPPFDPAAMQAMWQQMMGQFAKAASPQTGAPRSASGHGVPPPDMPAEMFKQMQKAYLESMSRWAEEYMRSPQFLENMKHSLENALAMRRQVEDFLRKASEQSFGSTLGVYDAVGAVRDAESWITRRIDEIASRLDAIEAKLGVERKAQKARRGGASGGASVRRGAKKTTTKKSGTKRRSPRKR